MDKEVVWDTGSEATPQEWDDSHFSPVLGDEAQRGQELCPRLQSWCRKSWDLIPGPSDFQVPKASYGPPPTPDTASARPGEFVSSTVRTRWDPDPRAPLLAFTTAAAPGPSQCHVLLSAPSPCGLPVAGSPPWRTRADGGTRGPRASAGSVCPWRGAISYEFKPHEPAPGTPSPLGAVGAAAGALATPPGGPYPVRVSPTPST